MSPKFSFLEEMKLLVIDIQVQEPKASAQLGRCPQDHMSHIRGCNILSSLPLVLLVRYKFE